MSSGGGMSLDRVEPVPDKVPDKVPGKVSGKRTTGRSAPEAPPSTPPATSSNVTPALGHSARMAEGAPPSRDEQSCG